MSKKEFRLKEFIVGKLRAATRKFPSFNEAKKLAKVNVRVEYNNGDSFLTVFPENGDPFSVSVHKKAQNRERVMYRCAMCGKLFFDYMYLINKKGVIKKMSMLAIDHVNPVVPVDRDHISWDDYITRLFCDVSNLQVLCNFKGEYNGERSCHSKKTKKEQQERAAHRAQKKCT